MTLVAELQKGIAAEVVAGDDWLTDFGGLAAARPRAIVRPRGEAELAHCLAVARRRGLGVSFRGAGHSVHGQSLCDGGILIESRPDGAELVVRDDGRIEVGTGSHWRDVEFALNRRGRSLPVTTDYLKLTVGGTLSVGGYGWCSPSHGAQIDHVERARLILPDGDAVWCSPDEHGELFRFSLAGLGRLGFLDRVVLRTVPFRPMTRVVTYRHGSFRELVEAIGWMARWDGPLPNFRATFHLREGTCEASYGIELESPADAATPAAAEPLARLGAPARTELVPMYRFVDHLRVTRWVDSLPDHHRLWTDFGFDHDGLVRFAASVDEQIASGGFDGGLKYVSLLAVAGGPSPFPFDLRGPAARGLRFTCGLYHMIARGDDAARARVLDSMDGALGRAIALGGRPYLYGWYELDDARCRAIYGADHERLLELRARLDPGGLVEAGRRHHAPPAMRSASAL